jgi:hypothetical protein
MIFLGIISFLGFFICIIMIIISAIKKNGKVKKWGIGIASCFIIFIVAAIVTPSKDEKLTNTQKVLKDVSEATNGTIQTSITETEKPKTWQRVMQFNGSSIKTTRKFTINSDEWKIKWSTYPGEYGDMNFQIYLYNNDGNLAGSGIIANIIGKGNDESYVYESGEYYLTINTAQNYRIIIEQYK